MRIATTFYLYFPDKIRVLMKDIKSGNLNFDTFKTCWNTKEKALEMELLGCNDPVPEDEKPGKFKLTIELKRIK